MPPKKADAGANGKGSPAKKAAGGATPPKKKADAKIAAHLTPEEEAERERIAAESAAAHEEEQKRLAAEAHKQKELLASTEAKTSDSLTPEELAGTNLAPCPCSGPEPALPVALQPCAAALSVELL